jgi:hypothetical protein
MPESRVETCTICGSELSPDDHKVSDHGDGWAHDECFALEQEDPAPSDDCPRPDLAVRRSE